MAKIHPTALVAPEAQLDDSVVVGPYTVIGPDVTIGAGTTIGAHCVIEGRTTLGRDNRVFQFNSLGSVPQDKKYAGEPCQLLIGDRNTIREFCTFSIGTDQDQGITRVGNDNWIMAYVHLAHDVQLGNHTTLANSTTLAGHVQVGDWVTIGGLCGVHQFVKIGAHVMVGFASAVTQDVPPFMLVDGNPLAVRGLNSVGLQRRGFSATRLATLKQMHRLLYRKGLTLADALAQIRQLDVQDAASSEDIAALLNFVAQAERGIAR